MLKLVLMKVLTKFTFFIRFVTTVLSLLFLQKIKRSSFLMNFFKQIFEFAYFFKALIFWFFLFLKI